MAECVAKRAKKRERDDGLIRTVLLHHFAGDSHRLTISCSEVMQEEYGLYVWPCSVVLAEYVWQNRLRFAGARVVEVSHPMAHETLHMSSGRVNHFFSEGDAVGRRYRAAGHSGRQTGSLSRVDGPGRPAPGMIIISGIQSQHCWPGSSSFRSSRTCKRHAA